MLAVDSKPTINKDKIVSNVKVITEFNVDLIRQYLEFDNMPHMDDSIKSLAVDIINLKEQGVIDALIKLGWTPPNKLDNKRSD